jgi:hypothetical protein
MTNLFDRTPEEHAEGRKDFLESYPGQVSITFTADEVASLLSVVALSECHCRTALLGKLALAMASRKLGREA